MCTVPALTRTCPRSTGARRAAETGWRRRCALRTHACTRARTGARTYAQEHARTHACTRARAHASTRRSTHAPTPMSTHARMHAGIVSTHTSSMHAGTRCLMVLAHVSLPTVVADREAVGYDNDSGADCDWEENTSCSQPRSTCGAHRSRADGPGAFGGKGAHPCLNFTTSQRPPRTPRTPCGVRCPPSLPHRASRRPSPRFRCLPVHRRACTWAPWS